MTDKTVTSQNLQCFEDIYIKYRDHIILYVKRQMHLSDEDAKDITTDAFLTLLKTWQDFEPKTEQAAVIWLKKTARFLTYNHNRKQSRLPTVSLGAMFDVPMDIDIPNMCAEKELYEKMMQKIKDQLSAEEYQLFEDIIMKECDIVQIAQKKNINVNTLYSRWRRLQKKIQHFL
ncbi:MAG: sigma-70 family RNA polymerase sigma factor [Clostridia bacterium]|nr:sigma-70 family RNA polymerase sigma factor [Clostridia bacterium]